MRISWTKVISLHKESTLVTICHDTEGCRKPLITFRTAIYEDFMTPLGKEFLEVAELNVNIWWPTGLVRMWACDGNNEILLQGRGTWEENR